MASKKQAYAEYRKIRDEAQELAIAERNLSAIYKMEREEEQRIQKSEQIDQARGKRQDPCCGRIQHRVL